MHRASIIPSRNITRWAPSAESSYQGEGSTHQFRWHRNQQRQSRRGCRTWIRMSGILSGPLGRNIWDV